MHKCPAGCARRSEDRHSARAQDERGVSIWAEIRMRAGDLLPIGRIRD